MSCATDRELAGRHSQALADADSCFAVADTFVVVAYSPWTASDKDQSSMLDRLDNIVALVLWNIAGVRGQVVLVDQLVAVRDMAACRSVQKRASIVAAAETGLGLHRKVVCGLDHIHHLAVDLVHLACLRAADRRTLEVVVGEVAAACYRVFHCFVGSSFVYVPGK